MLGNLRGNTSARPAPPLLLAPKRPTAQPHPDSPVHSCAGVVHTMFNTTSAGGGVEHVQQSNTAFELGVEHPRGPHRVQHLFNTCLSQVLNNRKRDFSSPPAHWLSYPSIHGSSVSLWDTVDVPSGSAEEVRQHKYTNNLILYVEPLGL